MEYVQSKKNGSKSPVIYIFTSSIIFLILLLYSFFHTWEYDEAWTYLSVKGQSFLDIITYKNFNIANNHLLNSLWFRTMQLAGAKNALVYRGASLASFPIYAYFLYRAVTYTADYWKRRHDWYLVLFFLPPVIFFFGIGRGYAMATAFFCGSLYYMKVYLQENTKRAYALFFLFGAISCLAIVSFFFPFVAMIIYIYLKRFPLRVFSLQNIITAILLTGLTLYVYHVGKTIILHDAIINGSDNLFAYGMYSSFVSLLNISILAFPAKELYNQLSLGLVSKVWVLVTLIPPALIIAVKYVRRYGELFVLVIMTLLLVASHYLLNSKYPLDRSVIYLLFLIYIPMALHIAASNNIFFRIHYCSVLLFGIINFAGFIYELARPTVYDIMKNKPTREYSIISDWPNKVDQIYNDLYFGRRLHFNYIVKEYETNLTLIDSSIRKAVIDARADFILVQKVNYNRNKDIFAHGFRVRPVMSSNSKEFYLIQRNE